MLKGHERNGPLDFDDLHLSGPAARLGALWRNAGGEPGHAAPQGGLPPMALFPLLPFLAMIDACAPPKVAWIGNGLKERLGGDPAGLVVDDTPLAPLLPSEALDGLRRAHPWQVSGELTAATGSVAATAAWFPLQNGAIGIVSTDP